MTWASSPSQILSPPPSNPHERFSTLHYLVNLGDKRQEAINWTHPDGDGEKRGHERPGPPRHQEHRGRQWPGENPVDEPSTHRHSFSSLNQYVPGHDTYSLTSCVVEMDTARVVEQRGANNMNPGGSTTPHRHHTAPRHTVPSCPAFSGRWHRYDRGVNSSTPARQARQASSPWPYVSEISILPYDTRRCSAGPSAASVVVLCVTSLTD